ncbi:MAG TPA: hypothetical protein VJ924_01100 [Alphaproteobacteria bacterium]|nr:hypothetical protein [Alphaproteobacteria bacterium]
MLDFVIKAFAIVFSLAFLVIPLLLAVSVLRTGFDVSGLIREPDQNGKASISRFQLFLFSYVIAGLYLVLSLEAGQFVEIPDGVLALLGISGGRFVVSKGIGRSSAPRGPREGKSEVEASQ